MYIDILKKQTNFKVIVLFSILYTAYENTLINLWYGQLR